MRGHTCCLLLLAVALLANTGFANAAAINVKKCKELGFTGEGRCADCDGLKEFVKDESLVAECKQCCIREEPKYLSVELQVCPQRIQALSEIKYFIEKLASKYNKVLRVEYIPGVSTRLKARRRDGGTETLRVDNWKRTAFEEFMKDQVRSASS